MNKKNKSQAQIAQELYELLSKKVDIFKDPQYKDHLDLYMYMQHNIYISSKDKELWCETCFHKNINPWACKYIIKESNQHKKDRKRRDCNIARCKTCKAIDKLEEKLSI